MVAAIIKKLQNLPESPGVYVFRDKDGKVMFVSKTTNIKQQVKEHLKGQTSKRDKVIQKFLADVEWTAVEDDYKATSLELELIKLYHPPLNGRRKDEKQYRFIRLTTTEQFPRAKVLKLNEAMGQTILGPFPKNRYVKRVFSWAVNYFNIADCGKTVVYGENSVIVQTCLRRKINQCLKPCEDVVDEKLYREQVQAFIEFFKGKNTEFLDFLTTQMNTAVEYQDFEKAGQFRDKISAIKKVIKFEES